MTDLYVYYRVARPRLTEARAAAAAVLDTMAASSGVTGTLHQRADDALTWMEVYRNIPDADPFLVTLDAAVDAAGLMACLDGERHVERFILCA
ncbi:DUF4936 family protein [Denitromonas halophila]|uniref:DUF4936 family protein n=1 Tax=Denitromonas halophila TaxID=1629404 RepID=A0A557QKJ4_9RHOO|nr:DUF4936 family protein [Denitromonas halophila]TVO53423.1 DUF4936 family protein [Denitromonas halophila]